MPFRLDRLLTLYFFGPLAGLFAPRQGIRIPILMYHSISDDPETGHPYFWINTSPARFGEQMKFLHDNGYKVISLSTAADLITGKLDPQGIGLGPRSPVPGPRSSMPDPPAEPLAPCSSVLVPGSPVPPSSNISAVSCNPPTSNLQPQTFYNSRYVVLTFDDGYRDFITQAFPILKKYGFSTTVFLPTTLIDSAGKPGLKGKYHLSWGEVRKLRDAGILFGSHTVSHRQLGGLSKGEIEFEISKSKELIEKELGHSVESFCYPYKFMEGDKEFIRMTEKALIEAGYKSAVTTRLGTANTKDDIFILKRIPMNSGDQRGFFKAKLGGGYDWLNGIQYLSKRLEMINSA